MVTVVGRRITFTAALKGEFKETRACRNSRTVIVHEKPDDGGQPTGNAGDRVGEGVIGIAKPK